MISSASTAASNSSFKDITKLIHDASSKIATGCTISSNEYQLSEAMNALELMDKKLDPGATPPLPSVASRITDGTLPLLTLQPQDILIIFDKLLQLEMSWLGGNSYAQTLFGCLYTHPITLSTMRAMLHLPTHPHRTDIHATGLRRPFGEKPSTEYPAPLIPATLPNGYSVPLLETDPLYGLIYTLLAVVTATLKSCELNHRMIMRGDLWEEDDYYNLLTGIDLAWGVSVEDIFLLLDTAEITLATKEIAIGKVRPVKRTEKMDVVKEVGDDENIYFPSLPHGCHITSALESTDEKNNSVSLDGDIEFLRQRICARRAYLVTQILLSEPMAAIAPLPLPTWGRRYRLNNARIACIATLNAIRIHPTLSSSSSTSTVSTSTSTTSSTTTTTRVEEEDIYIPGFFPEYRKLLITGQMPRYLAPPTSLVNAIEVWRMHLCALQIVLQIPALASYNPSAEFSYEKDIKLPAQLSKPQILADEVALNFGFPLSPILAIGQEEEINTLPASLSDLYPILVASFSARLPHLVKTSENKVAIPLESLGQAASLLKWPITAKEKTGDALTTPQPEIPYSGLFDPPIWNVLATEGKIPSTQKRAHVSLSALLQILEDFSKLNTDIVIRSLLAAILLQYAPPPPRDGTSVPPPVSSVPAGISPDSFDACRLGSVVFGSHTLHELVQRSIFDAGVPLELMIRDDTRHLVAMLTTLIQQLLRLWCCTRLHLRTKLPGQFRDWGWVQSEIDFVENQYVSSLDTLFRDSLDAHVAACVGSTLPPVGRPLSLTESTRIFNLLSTATYTRIMPWALSIILQLMRVHFEIGFDLDLFHVDELSVVYWYMDHILSQSAKQVRLLEGARFLTSLVPEVSALTIHSALRLCGRDINEAVHDAPIVASPLKSTTLLQEESTNKPSLKTKDNTIPKNKKTSKNKKDSSKEEDIDDILLAEAAAESLGLEHETPEEKAKHARLLAIRNEGLRVVIGIDLVRMNVQSSSFLYSTTSDLLAGEIELCRGHIRFHAALHMIGRTSTLYNTYVKETPDFRNPKLAFDVRFRDFLHLTIPPPLTFKDFCDAFEVKQYDSACASRLLSDAMTRYDTAFEYFRRARTSLGTLGNNNSITSNWKSSIQLGQIARNQEFLFAILLDPGSSEETITTNVSTPTKNNVSKNNTKKGKEQKIDMNVSSTGNVSNVKSAFGVKQKDLGTYLPELVTNFDRRKALLKLLSSPNSIPINAFMREQKPLPPKSNTLLHSVRTGLYIDKLQRIIVSSRILVTKIQNSGELIKLDIPRALSTMNKEKEISNARIKAETLVASANEAKISFEKISEEVKAAVFSKSKLSPSLVSAAKHANDEFNKIQDTAKEATLYLQNLLENPNAESLSFPLALVPSKYRLQTVIVEGIPFRTFVIPEMEISS